MEPRVSSPREAPDLPRDRPVQPRDARRRRELIDATIQSIASHGLSGTTVARVARIAGLSTGIVNFYFQAKDALLLATLEYVDAQYMLRQDEASLAAGDDPVRQLETMIDAAFDPEICHPNRVAVWAAFWGEAGARDDYMRICASREADMEARVVAAFESIAAGGDCAHLQPEALGRAFHHLLSSLPESMLGDQGPFDFERAHSTCRGFLRSVFPREFPQDPPRASATGASRPGSETHSQARFASLPGWVYHDPEFFELEKTALFQRHWLLAGHCSHLPKAGDYLTLDIVGERVFVIRGQDGRLRAFDNVCRHRAAQLVHGSSGNCAGNIVCPYHGWRYDSKGELRAVPSEASFVDLKRKEIRLPELELEEWMGFIFVRFGGKSLGVKNIMQEFEEEASFYRFAEMEKSGERTSLHCDFNWKLFVENDAEGYHIETAHPGLRRLFGRNYVEDLGKGEASHAISLLQERESPVWAERLYQRLLPEVNHLPPRLRRAWAYFGAFPTAVIQAAPDTTEAYQILPTGPESCTLTHFRVALPDARREMRAARYLGQRIVRNVMREDLEICRSTNLGMKSGRHIRGPLSALEAGVGIFHEKIRKLIPVAGVSQRPSPGRVRSLNLQLERGGPLPDPLA